MADNNSIPCSHSALDVQSLWPMRPIKAPSDKEVPFNEDGNRRYEIETPGGKIWADESRSNWWRYPVQYCGHLNALIEAGLVLQDWLPGQPGNAVHTQSVTFVDGFPRLLPIGKGCRINAADRKCCISISRQGYSDHFIVRKRSTQEEYDTAKRREKTQQANREAEREAEKLAESAKTPTLMKSEAVSIMKGARNLVLGQIDDTDCAVRFTDESIWRVIGAIETVIEAINDGQVRKNKVASRQEISSIRVQAAKRDIPLQQFLQKLGCS